MTESENIKDIAAAGTAEELILSADGVRMAVEAILFAAGHPMTYEKIADAVGISTEEAEACADELQMMYEGRGIQLIKLQQGCQLVTKEPFLPYIRKALGIRRGGNLSRASLETLAIIAYHQPVTRSYVDEVRGVDTGYVVSSLVEKGLIASKGRLDVPGRPTLYGTTDAFLRVFGLESIEQLPPMSLFLQKNEDGKDPDASAELLEESVAD
ncbi:MAG: SMC-Scp complex subunit ScpB [Clostridia bacterium]|nr:SMC-Scp complex subunit ScpB [Clostridia bacterium]